MEGGDTGLVDILALGSTTDWVRLRWSSTSVPVWMSILESRLMDGLSRRSNFGSGMAVVLSGCVAGKGARELSAMAGW